MQAMNIWPLSPTGPFYPAQLTNPAINNQLSKPRVGLGVICRCQPQKYGVECLLLKRGPKFVSPFKWSFPGGRLDEDDDLDDDGEKGTMRELGKECGGGSPPGLPPLIHIECYKSGRVRIAIHVASSCYDNVVLKCERVLMTYKIFHLCTMKLYHTYDI